MILLAECEKEIDIWLDKQLILRKALNVSLEKWNEEVEVPNDGGVDKEQTVILIALIKEDVFESDEVAVEVRGVFDMLDVALMVVEAAMAVLPGGWSPNLLVNNTRLD